jgi:hypothetical protein
MTESYTIDGKKYAPCAFGDRAQWYKNIVTDPRVTIQSARGAESAIAVRVTDGEELLSLLDAVGKRAQFMLDRYLAWLDVGPDTEDIIAKKDRFYWLRFDPSDVIAPPPLEADLIWVWPVAAVGLAIAWLIGRGRR